MVITVDSNILLSIFIRDSVYERSAALLDKYSSSEFVINDCIYLELGVHFDGFQRLEDALDILEVKLIRQPDMEYSLILKAWTTYLKRKTFVCPSCKKSIDPVCPDCGTVQSFRQRILVDFLIGGFASKNSQGILTLDTAYYKNYFPELTVFD